MNRMLFVIAPLTAFMLGMNGAGMAAGMSSESSLIPAETQDGSSPRMGHTMQRGMHGRGMMGGMSSGMMDMMGACPMMSGASGANAKVLMQMHGEMLRAMGEIMMKYADKLEMPSPPK